MSKKLICIDVNSNLREARKLMEKHKISRLLVKYKGNIIGIITERDLAERFGSWRERRISDSKIHVSSAFTSHLLRVKEDDDLRKASEIMLRNGISSVVVERDGRITGIITKTDLIRYLKNSTKKVKDFMSKRVFSLEIGSSLLQARRIMLERGIKRLPITLGGKIVGMITEKDIAKALGLFRKISEGRHWDEKMKKIKVEHIMSKDIISITPNDTLGKAVKVMLRKRISGLPVIENDRLVGIITKTDLIKAI